MGTRREPERATEVKRHPNQKSINPHCDSSLGCGGVTIGARRRISRCKPVRTPLKTALNFESDAELSRRAQGRGRKWQTIRDQFPKAETKPGRFTRCVFSESSNSPNAPAGARSRFRVNVNACFSPIL